MGWIVRVDSGGRVCLVGVGCVSEGVFGVVWGWVFLVGRGGGIVGCISFVW